MSIRLNVAAVIIRDHRILLVEFDDETGLHYNLPGGGVEDRESIYDALRREVWEECRATISKINSLLMVWEYIDVRQNYKYGEGHKVAMVFPCTLQDGSEPRFPNQPDLHQTGIRWVALDDLHTISLIPDIASRLVPLLQGQKPTPIHIEDDL